ncbi:MAG: bifunctional folylpolyglutamate synthase/dihydrofolate synthase [Thermoplasmata archaeon]|jgi:dihydrofolate synthase/folylpolyglutamate synthase
MVQNIEEIDYLYSLSRFGIKLGLDVMTNLANKLGSPQNYYKTFHITGSNGKGSTSAMLYTILRQKYSSGLYTSPHIKEFNERIMVNDKYIENEFIKDWVRRNKKIVEDMAKIGMQPTFFEFTTAMAFDYFKEKKIDVAVIEVGMGGRLDATNIIIPESSGIVTISLEHTDRLGNTVEKIAYEKAGIIKKGKPVVIGVEDEKAQRTIEKIANEKGSKVYDVNELYDVSNVEISLEGTRYRAKKDQKIYDVSIPLIGKYQIKNSLISITMAELFDPSLDYKFIKNVKFPGRFEIKSRKPMVIIDAAHNPEAAKVLVENIKLLFNKNPLVVMTQLKDKNSLEFFRIISEIVDHAIITEVKDERRKDAEILAHEARNFIKNVEVIRESNNAFERAFESSDFILITGSIYLLGEFEEWYSKRQ